MTSILVVDLSSDAGGIADSTSVLTDYASNVYASHDSIYIASNTYDGEGHTSTTIQQFDVAEDGASVDLTAVGNVRGTLLNQFAMDEHEGHLRLVTSTGWGEARTNSLFVLASQGTSLDVVGSIDDIASGESVFAVRFVGDEAFVVTFRVIDPLFTINLSDPADPTIVGELEIPGFSNYLHPISEDLLLGLGRAGDRFNSSPQLSLFDVSDFALPDRVDQFIFEGVSWSEAFANHHAISYFADSQIAVIPLFGSYRSCDGFGVVGDCEPRAKNGFWVVQIDTSSDDKTINLLGIVEHADAPLRSVRIDDNLFTISTNHVKVTELSNPDELIDEVYIGRVAFGDYFNVDERDLGKTLDVLANDHVEADASLFEVSSTAKGGIVAIAEDGKTLVYTPPEDPGVRHDSFEYTVESGGQIDSATVRVQISRESTKARMIRLATEHLVERYGIDKSEGEFQLTSAVSVDWPNGCLGVAHNDEVCTQAIVPGFKIIFEYALAQVVYHTDSGGRVVPVNDPVISSESVIQIRAEVVDAAGNPVTSLLEGESATLLIHATDLRDDPLGVFASYIDVRFDPNRAKEVGPIDHGVTFVHGNSGVVTTDGLIDEVGGFTPSGDPLSTQVVSIPFVAGVSGELRFTTEPADEKPAHDMLVFGLNSPIPRRLVEYGDVVIEVLGSLQNEVDPTDANMDGKMTPLDALVVMNHINRFGSGPVNGGAVRALRAAASDAHSRWFAADVNRDWFISPIDVLLIFNALADRHRIFAEGEAETLAYEASIPEAFASLAEERQRSGVRSQGSDVELTRPQLKVTDLGPSVSKSIARTSHKTEIKPSDLLVDTRATTEVFDSSTAVVRSTRLATLEDSCDEDRLFAELATATDGAWWLE